MDRTYWLSIDSKVWNEAASDRKTPSLLSEVI